MNINWYSFYHKLRTISSIVLILGLIVLTPFLSVGNDGFFDTSGDVPFLICAFIVAAFSSLMVSKYKDLRNIPEITTKKEGKIYGIIGILLIVMFALFVIALPLIFK